MQFWFYDVGVMVFTASDTVQPLDYLGMFASQVSESKNDGSDARCLSAGELQSLCLKDKRHHTVAIER